MAFRNNRNKRGRQVQEERKQIGPKSWVFLVFLLAATTASSTGVIYTTYKSRHLLNELQQLERQRNTLQVEWGQLLLEQSSLVSQGRIENMAITELGMKIPAMDNMVVVKGD